jgi:hypothetical protein
MRAVLWLLCACLLCTALAACGGSGGASNREQITNLFKSVDTAMARGDYATACAHLSARQQAKVVAGAKRAGVNVSSCGDALTALVKLTGISRAQLAHAFGGGSAPHVQSISIHGNQATVTYTTTGSGHTYRETDGLVRENGQWKADQIIKRSQQTG